MSRNEQFIDVDDPPPCSEKPELFYSPTLDGREEPDRAGREAAAKALCFSCKYRMRCLFLAMYFHERWGVWGGMSESERRDFWRHIKEEGYTEVPQGLEFWASLFAFYKAGPGVEIEEARAKM